MGHNMSSATPSPRAAASGAPRGYRSSATVGQGPSAGHANRLLQEPSCQQQGNQQVATGNGSLA